MGHEKNIFNSGSHIDLVGGLKHIPRPLGEGARRIDLYGVSRTVAKWGGLPAWLGHYAWFSPFVVGILWLLVAGGARSES